MRTILGLVCLALTLPAWSQTPAPVYVRFQFGARSATSSFSSAADLERAQNAIASTLAELCHGRLEWWTFKAATTANDRPCLNVSLKEGIDWQIVVTLTDRMGVLLEPRWQGTLFTAQDFEIQATRLRVDGWGSVIAAQLDQEILEPKHGELMNALEQNAALLYMAKLPGAGATAPVLLPLRWNEYKNLSTSVFTILCTADAGHLVKLQSNGTGVAVPFTDVNPPFEALGAQLSKWEDNDQLQPIETQLNNVPTLRPIAVFVKEYRTAWSVADQ